MRDVLILFFHLIVTIIRLVQPSGIRSTILRFHRLLVSRKYRVLFWPRRRPGKPGLQGPSSDLIAAIVEMKRRNPGFGYQRIAEQQSLAPRDLLESQVTKHSNTGLSGDLSKFPVRQRARHRAVCATASKTVPKVTDWLEKAGDGLYPSILQIAGVTTGSRSSEQGSERRQENREPHGHAETLIRRSQQLQKN